MSTPLVSVIMPYYKKSEFINASVNSILNQSFKEFEIILIDDELTENSYEILENVKNRCKN